MLKRFLPREESFFEYFQKLADLLVKAAQQFQSMLNDLANLQTYITAIAEYEEQGDQLTLKTFEMLHKTFITPFDRHDINRLTSGLDDILDRINRCAQRFPFYQLHSVPQEIFMLAEIAAQATVHLKHAVDQLDSLKNIEDILAICLQINRLASEADLMLIAGMSKLFQDEDNFKQFIRLKEIYEHTKAITNGCQNVADIVKGIALEYT